ncbi:MAG: hypothetical protein AB7S61_09675 [Methanoregulaceae archaeon]
MNNPEWRWVYVSLLAAGFFLVVAVYANAAMDCLSGVCAVTFISGFLFICGVATALLFWTRARAMDAILAGEGLLASWTYPVEEMRQSAEREYQDYREANRSLLYVVGGFILIAMVLMILFGGEAGLLTAGVLFGVLVLCGIASVVAPMLEYRRASSSPGRAVITRQGIVYRGAVYPFRSFLMRMDDVRFLKKSRTHSPLLAFSFLQLVGLYILRPFEVRVPVPQGEVENAQRIAALLGGPATEEDEEVPGVSGDEGEVC